MFSFLKYTLSIIFFFTLISTYSYGYNCFEFYQKQAERECGKVYESKNVLNRDNYNLCRDKVFEKVNNSQTCKNLTEEKIKADQKLLLKGLFFGILGIAAIYIVFGRIAEILNSIFKFSGINKKNKKNSWESFKKNMENKKKSYSKTAKNDHNKTDIDERLQRLKKLFDDQIITKEEYEEQRKKIIGDI